MTPAPPTPPPADRSPCRVPGAGRVRFGVVLASVVGIAAACANNGLPESATSQGDQVTNLWGVFLWLAVAVAGLIWVLTGYTIVTSMLRRRRGSAEAVPRQKQYNTPLEIVYTAIPLLMVAGLFWATTVVTDDLDDVTSSDLTVEVVGFQWQWQFRYPEQDLVPDTEVVVSGQPGPDGYPQMVLPVGARVRFELRADDVIHSFWVPEFLEKRDLIPGVTTSPENVIEVDVTREGEWVGRCAEYCGLNHWMMAFSVRAVPADEFDAWVREAQAGTQPMIAGSVPGSTATTNPVSGS